MLFFSEKDNKLSISEEVRQYFQKHPFFNLQLNFSQNFQFGFVLPTVSPMSSDSRRYIRFSLTLEARRSMDNGSFMPILINQIGIGGCLIDWDEMVNVGENVRIELLLPNGNWLPLNCKILYRMPESALGVKFQDISRFEQELIAKLINVNLVENDLPYENPFATPIEFNPKNESLPDQQNSIKPFETNEILA
jgi:hypothetical protein